MSSIHETSLRYLVDFANGKSDHPLLQKIKEVEETKCVDLHTVELAEVTAIFFRQLLVENDEVLSGMIANISSMTPTELMASVETRLRPLLKEILSIEDLSAKGVEGKSLVDRIQHVVDTIRDPQEKTTLDVSWLKHKTATTAVNYAKSELVEVMGDYKKQCRDLREELYRDSGSTVAAEFAKVTAKTVYNFLSDEILHVEERDPVVRPFFLKGNIFTDDTAFTTEPQYTLLGDILAGLLKDVPGGFQKVIELNILKGTSNIVAFLKELKTKQPFFLVDLCNRCLADLAKDPEYAELTIDEKQVKLVEEFTKKATELIFDIGFPNGPKDLIMPSLGGAHHIVRHKLWGLVQDVLKDQMASFLTDLPGKSDLKNMLLIEGYSALTPFLATKTTSQGPVTRAAQVTRQTAQTMTLAPVGFVFIFIRLIITSILSVFQQRGVPPVNPKNIYPDQGTFNANLAKLANQIIQDTDSKLLKFIASKKLDSFINEYGPNIVEAIREIDYMEIFNAQFEGFIASVINPGGSWQGEGKEKHYQVASLKIPKTLKEQEDKVALMQKEEEARELEVDRLQRSLGNNIDGLLREIADAYKVEHADFTEDELATKNAAEKIANKIHKFWAAFANALVYRLVRLAAFILDAKGKIRSSAGAFHRKMQRVPQERFVMTAVQFGAKELRVEHERG